MKKHLPLLLFLIASICLRAEQPGSSTTVQKKSGITDRIVYVTITNPLLYGKAGAAISLRNTSRDYFMYANYRFAPGVMGTKAYFANGSYGSAKPNTDANIVAGFDIGAQIRFRDPALSKPYSAYLKDVEKQSNFYSGVLFEFTYTHSTFLREASRSVNGTSWVWEPKFGGLIGWTLNAGNVFFDIHASLALGVSVIDYRDLDNDKINGIQRLDATVGLLRYDICFLVGYKF